MADADTQGLEAVIVIYRIGELPQVVSERPRHRADTGEYWYLCDVDGGSGIDITPPLVAGEVG